MNNDIEKLDLRSEKVRRIMNERPAWIIQYGTLLITVVLIILSFVTFCFIL